ncbi:hypothetical protein SAV14893_074800 [Streptomyces avermitilis]|uniref:Uncharacterized protein n=1 Tax=Streptomyces avermitilis TaxID=33903 RepID=A0A4D4MIS6_STRAX|nr:hypothetical protein SAVMC3_87730 [Streptomyces avermitilis]GDY68087.1 hypothetical protein SAV14893_074800 [Streptomyces avermitilis]GDY71575.1 hypothetical protein SAV31267_010600 [Streptomyces avermitilis]
MKRPSAAAVHEGRVAPSAVDGTARQDPDGLGIGTGEGAPEHGWSATMCPNGHMSLPLRLMTSGGRNASLPS